MTADHCSYCDGFPMDRSGRTRKTIDHFQPKETFPEHAFTWSNLFACCDACQNVKGTRFLEDLLAPDKPDYRFERFFLFNYRSGAIEVNP